MTREDALLVVVAFTALLLVVLAWAWRRRTRRDAVWSAPVGEIPAGARETALFETLYVATTRHGEPLERLAIGGLAFRSRAALTVTDQGFALDLTGRPRLFFAASRLDDVAQATVAIDRVVERDGLVRVTWRIDDDTIVDSYFRPQDASARALADALRGILPIPTGSDA